MLFLANAKKLLCIITGLSILFSGSVFAQVFDGDDETSSWILDLWSPTTNGDIASGDEDSEWDIGGAPDVPANPETTQVVTSSGSSRGGRLGTANYSLKDRSALVSMERQAMVAKQDEEEKLMHTAPVKESLPEIADDTYHAPLEMVDHVLIAEAGRNDLVDSLIDSWEKPIAKKEVVVRTENTTKVVKSSAPLSTSVTKTIQFLGNNAILLKSEPLLIHKTHLLSWEGMDEDITSYKRNVVKKMILDTLVFTGKVLFSVGILGILLALFFREKFNIYTRRKTRQLTLFSLLK
jgi:hypothetical protein